ncbi:30S ribosomal protein S8 [Candidatus Cytomitobacter indipagum]|uniref:Small ribosomal subunit protein uS8 n=1 Tax=Candidatus Cytomitobacter indipagum TaxID=2601575 RepID=A0A5C0UF17_9PROT|nr:30S ribosomal protein S8 [Candidatus Cytomitobacter indipagum]QEK38233.1 30S ribosomal protein S8 [Candidatus Cytomitobacter indipagum]
MNDKISDTLTRIRNAYLVGKDSTNVQKSNFVRNVLNVMKEEGFIEKLDESEREIIITLKYDRGYPVISSLRRISKSSRRVHVDLAQIKKLRQISKMLILSTSKGVISDVSAIAHGIGGEIVCEVR